MVSAREAKSCFAFMARQDPDAEPMTELRVQKMLYFAQGHCLKRYDRKLFDDEIEAWQHGPVVRSVYEQSRRDANWENMPVEPDPSFDIEKIPYEDFELMTDVYLAYNRYTTAHLRGMTHVAGSPWQKTYDKNEKRTISPMDISAYFRDHVDEIGLQSDLDAIPEIGYISHGVLILPKDLEDSDS